MMNYIIQKFKPLTVDHFKLMNKKYKQNRIVNFTIPMKLTGDNHKCIFLVVVVSAGR